MLKRGPLLQVVRGISFCLMILTNLWFVLLMLRLVEGLFNYTIASRDPDLREEDRQEIMSQLLHQNVSYAILFPFSCIQNVLSWLSSITLSHKSLWWTALFSVLSCLGCTFILWHVETKSACHSSLPNTPFIGICLFAGQTCSSFLLFRLTAWVVYTIAFEP